MLHEEILPRWQGACIVAGTGPSLTESVAEQCKGCRVVAVSDAHRLFPDAAVLYSCDRMWWQVHHRAARKFAGERWSVHGAETDKLGIAAKFGVQLVFGERKPGFSFDRRKIHYGGNSGFQAINLTIHWGATLILLVGFDMHGTHFFGEHGAGLKRNNPYKTWIERFRVAAEGLPSHIHIVNCTPGSALDCFPRMDLEDALYGLETNHAA